jgi:hypothetical protein
VLVAIQIWIETPKMINFSLGKGKVKSPYEPYDDIGSSSIPNAYAIFNSQLIQYGNQILA